MSDQSKGEGTKPNLKISSLPKLNKQTNNKIKLQCMLLPPSKNVIACTKQERTADDSQETVTMLKQVFLHSPCGTWR